MGSVYSMVRLGGSPDEAYFALTVPYTLYGTRSGTLPKIG